MSLKISIQYFLHQIEIPSLSVEHAQRCEELITENNILKAWTQTPNS